MRPMVQRARARLRSDVLDAAEELAGEFSMPELARRVGVSRQTLYSEFGDRHGVARALALRATERFLDGIEQALAGASDLHTAWVDAVSAALRQARNPLVKRLVTEDGVFGADSEPIVVAARDRAAGYLARRWPGLDPAAVRLAADTAARLTVSHIVLPLAPDETVAEDVATVVGRILVSG